MIHIYLSKIKNFVQVASMRVKNFLARYRLVFTAVLIALFLVALIASRATKKTASPEPEVTVQPLTVKTLKVGEQVLREETVGTVKNLTSITLVAQTAGPVNKVYVTEGKEIKKDAAISYQTTGYGTGNVSSVQRQIAQKSSTLAEETLKNTVEIVAKNRESADLSQDNSDELRKISEESLSGTRKLVDTTRLVVEKIEADLKATPTTDSATIQGLRQQLISFQSGLNQAESGLRNLEYSVNKEKPPSKIVSATKELAYKTTELQLKAAELSRDIAQLNVKAAQIAEALSRVVAPFAGTVERVYVQPGQYLSPGTPIAKIKGEDKLCLVIQVSGFLASRISSGQPLQLLVNGKTYQLPITHISSSPTAGKLYEVLAVVPSEYAEFIQEDQTVNVSLPLSSTEKISGDRFLPLDAIFLTNTSKYVLVVKNGQAEKQSIETGEIIGDQVQVKVGINLGDEVILDRRVIEGQQVQVVNGS